MSLLMDSKKLTKSMVRIGKITMSIKDDFNLHAEEMILKTQHGTVSTLLKTINPA